MPNLSPPSRAAISALASAERIRSATDVASERFVDRLEAAEINDQNGRAFGRKVWIRQQLREPFVEHQTVAEFGEGVGTLFG